MTESNQPVNPLISDLAGDVDMRDLVEQFVNELPQRLEAIQRTLASEDLAALGRLVHQLKGAAGSYGFRDVSSQAAELQSSIHAHGNLIEITREVRDLAELCRRVRANPAPQ